MVEGDRNKCILGLPLTKIEKNNLSQLCVSLSKWTISYMYGFIQKHLILSIIDFVKCHT